MQFLMEVSCDVIHDVIVCKSYVFADEQGFRLLFPVVENVLTQINIQLAPRREFVIWILACIFTKKKCFIDYRVAQQETTFTRIFSRNLILQTKTPEKEHVNMAKYQAECETCFKANVFIFILIFRCSG